MAAMLVAMWVGGSSTAHATSLDRPWTSLAYPPAFEHVSVEQGLSQSSVHAIAQDKLGFLWMGTDAGLNRYDGFHFQTFHPDGSGRSLAGDWIERIVPDRHGYLWIAARNAGLTLLDPESLAMIQIPISTKPGGLPARTVNAILQDRDALWIGTDSDGLFRVNRDWAPPAEPRFERITFSNDGKNAPKRVSALFLDHDGALWLASPERGLGRLASDRHASTLAFDFYPSDPNQPSTSCPALVNAIGEDAFGKLWLGGDDGLAIFDPVSSQFTRWTSAQFTTGIGRVLDILRDRTDTLWVAGDGLGLFKAPPRPHRDDPILFDHFAHDPKDAGSLSRNGLQCVFEDASGMLWVSAYQGGLNKVVLNPASQHDRERPSVFQYRNNAADPWSLSGDTISAIGEDRFGNLWIGTDGFGLNRLVAPTSPGQPAHFEHFRHDPTHAPGSLQSDVILTTHLDSQKQLWLGSYLGGLIRVDQTSATARPTFTHFRHDPQDPDSLQSDFVRDILDDGRGGFWIAFDAGGGLDHFDPGTKKAKHYVVGEGPRALKNGNVMRIVTDRYGTLWIATQLGLHRFNPVTGEFRVYQPGRPDALSNVFINTLYLAPSGVLWIGNKRGGLNSTEIPPWDGPEPRFSTYGKAAGVSDGAVMSILPDSKGDLWIATHRALYHFDTRRMKASGFTFQRELRRAEFIWNAAYVGAHGEMFFGSNDGLTVFHPDDIVPNGVRPVLAFTDFRVRSQSLPLRSHMDATRPAKGIPEIVLRPDESMFSLDFAALHFAAPDQNQYAYRLDGLDQGWNEIGNRHSLTYSALPPGSYLLSVRASNCDGISSRDDLKLRIRMLPRWHATWWFRALIAAGVLVLFYVLVRVRLRVLRHRNATLEQKVEERTRELGQRNDALRIVLDNVDQGLFRVDLEGRMLEERSTIVDRWFGPCKGRPDLAAYVAADARFADAFMIGMEALRDAVMPLDLCLDQLPKRLVAAGRHFDCRYLPIEDNGTLRALLCVLDDVTEGLKRAEDDAEHRDLVAAFMAFTRDRAGFLVFFSEAEGILRELGRADLDPSKRKRLLHTLKGNAGVPGLRRIAELCHLAETELEIDAVVSVETLGRLHDHWAKVAQALGAVADRDGRAVIELSDGDLEALALRVQRGASALELLSELPRLRWEPVERPLARLAEHGRVLARRLRGAEVDVRVQADGLRLDPERWNPLWSALVHLVRNAVDHGLESAGERATAGKPPRTMLRLEARSSEGGLRLEIEDDGRGIDWETVRRLCRKRGLPSETRADLFQALLRPDFSSREQVTETSGRGVGLAAVAASVAERGGTLSVESEPGRGTRWVLNLPLDREPSTSPAHPPVRFTSSQSTPESVGS
jgi:ligand-binding sensor domain-containing protein/HPt (histidine-containing phosphotransfer) domain-containing protein/PAS domain-containing protein